jgi:hypothetical protein
MRAMFAGLLLLCASASAQEGFPLDGTWRGEHIAADGSHRTIVLVMQWDGKQIAGTINPGKSAMQFTAATLVPDGWKVTFAAKNAAGEKIAFNGAISNLGKYDRALSGQWTEGAASHAVRFVRE